MALKQQSEESKYIKRINEQLSEVSKLINVTDDNPLLAAWSRAVRESGLEYTKDPETNRYKVRNTAANRSKVTELQRTISKYSPKTVGEYSSEIKTELEREAHKLSAQMGDAAADKFVKKYTSRESIKKRIEIHSIERKISHMLKVVYNQTGSTNIGRKLSELSRGKTAQERDSVAIYNEFGRISDEFRRIQMDALTAEERQRAEDLHNIQKDYPWEI